MYTETIRGSRVIPRSGNFILRDHKSGKNFPRSYSRPIESTLHGVVPRDTSESIPEIRDKMQFRILETEEHKRNEK